MPKIMKVSEAAYALIRDRAKANGGTLIVALDRLLGIGVPSSLAEEAAPVGLPGPKRRRATVTPHPLSSVEAAYAQSLQTTTRALGAPAKNEAVLNELHTRAVTRDVCPTCGCSRATHREDNGRCENHPTCRWLARMKQAK